MEDDEEIRSHQSIGSRSGSPDSPPANRRISVTVASAAPSQNTLTLALPFQQPKNVGSGGGAGGNGGGGGGGGGGGREDCWSEGATAILIDAWGERYLELSRGNLKQKHWKEVADIVSSRVDYLKVPKTDIQCKNRIDTVKKKYKLEKAKIAAGGGPSNWSFYERLDHLIGPTATAKSGGVSKSALNTPPLRTVPVGIPVGVRSAPVQSLRLKQQQERQQQQQLQQLQLQQQQQKQLQMQQQQQQQQKQLQLQLQQQRKRLPPPPAYSDSESEQEVTPDSPESDLYGQKRARLPFNSRQQQQQEKGRGSRENNWGDSVKELTRAISKFGEAYEQAESLKLQQMVEMQKQSMKFAKELELQRMQFFMKMQLELSQLKQTRRGGVGNTNNNHHNSLNHNHHNSTHNNISNNNNNHSDDSNN